MCQQINTEKVILTNGEQIYYRECGTGPVLVILHGNMTSSFHLEEFMKSISSKLRVIAPDMRGFGLSSYKNPISSLNDLSDDIANLLKQLNIESYAIAGWSTGGGVAIQHCINHSEKISQLVLISSIGMDGYPIKANGGQGDYLKSKQAILDDPMFAPIFTAFKNKDKDFVRGLWDMVVYNHNKPTAQDYELLIDDVLTQVNLADIYFSLSIFNLTHDFNGVINGTGQIHQFKTPTLILHGEDDLIISIDTALHTHKMITDLEIPITIKTYPNSGHSLFIDQLDDISHQVLTFIK
ncbi:alpha/beta hydrolase [Shewanella sp. D64]|uniref:intracellular short-chain-length polyhydroxyalkanoate depolymerase n=1 Tax=unclassified Shewanella TaxID=196818 RepID=UPI0022BA2783|nr:MULTISPECIES: alpha/beta hydrolase [unclassified Shewanella]MEC4726028.1 alpha/beta hydrolase [Shewanella sp. D64]MEC4737283.1 alpha/beta hydrolase [Shewanella sp. E94]WBJ93660.1 alpha/beta hydrolase [Shewanella sp. MTB7]